MQIQVIGMAWYKRENYTRNKSMFEDGNKLHDTYDEWLKAAEIGRKSLESKGAKVVCVDIDPDEFSAWCKKSGMKLNAEARTSYTNEAAYKSLGNISQ